MGDRKRNFTDDEGNAGARHSEQLTARRIVASAANIAQSKRRRGKAHLDGEHIVRFRHSFSCSLDDHAGVTLKACRLLQGVHMASDLGDGIEHADGHGRV
jgi:hypothetical protein